MTFLHFAGFLIYMISLSVLMKSPLPPPLDLDSLIRMINVEQKDLARSDNPSYFENVQIMGLMHCLTALRDDNMRPLTCLIASSCDKHTFWRPLTQNLRGILHERVI